jgi:hypothetical protein
LVVLARASLVLRAWLRRHVDLAWGLAVAITVEAEMVSRGTPLFPTGIVVTCAVLLGVMLFVGHDR